MEKGIEEVLDASARLLAEMKRGTPERSMLSSITKTLKRRFQEARQQQQRQPSSQVTPSKSTSAALSSSPTSVVPPGSPISQQFGGRDLPAAGAPSDLSEPIASAKARSPETLRVSGVTKVTPPSSPTPPTSSSTPLQLFLSSDEELSRFAYACRMSIVGGNGGIARNSPRMLTAALELVAVTLTSGMLPLELVTPIPAFAASESTASGAQMFFSKLLGSKKPALSPSGGSGASDLPSSRGAPLTSSGGTRAPAETSERKENMREGLVDAVLAAADLLPSKDGNERFFFVMIASLKASAVPRLSRMYSSDTQSHTLRHLQLSIHGDRLLRVFRVLLGFCASPPGLSSILIDEAQTALHVITRALSKYVEQESLSEEHYRSAAGGEPHHVASFNSTESLPAGTPLLPLSSAIGSSSAGGKRREASFEEHVPESTETDDVVAAEEAIDHHFETSPICASASTSPAVPVPPEQPSGASVPGFGATNGSPAPAALPNAASPLRVRGITDMKLLLELCGHVVRLTALSGVSSVPQWAESLGTEGGSVTAADGEGPPAPTDSAGGALGGPGSRSGGGLTEEGSLRYSLPAHPLNVHALVTVLNFLLYSIVNGGPQFRKSRDIIQLLRAVIVPAAIRTSITGDVDVFRLSIKVLLSCCLRFGPHMVVETSTVFRHVYFRVLDSTFTSLEHKLLVLDAFGSYIEEPQLLLGLFLNYDCNTRSQSIYEMMIHYLGALAMPPALQVCNANLAAELRQKLTVRVEYEVPEQLRRKALLSLLQVSDSNIQWIERFEYDQEGDGLTSASGSKAAEPVGVNAAESLPSHHTRTASSPQFAEQREGGVQRSNPHLSLPGGEVLGPSMSGGSATMMAVTSNTEAFLQARRYKDAFRKFLELFNGNAAPEAAIEYLKGSVPLLEGDVPTTMGAHNAQAEVKSKPDTSTHFLTPAVAAAEGKAEGATAGNADGVDIPLSGQTAVTCEADTPYNANEGPLPSTTNDVDGAARLSAQQVARFLRANEEYVDKMVLGDYFAKCFRRASSRVVFEEWIGLHDFAGKTLDEALRLFLGGFKLLGEAQVVDKTMELFAAQYFRQNPGVFNSADTAFILSFSICMLNTDAHSRHIKAKMTKEGFIQNNKGIDEGADIDPAILGGIYERIRKDEIVLRPSPKCGTQPLLRASAVASESGSSSSKVALNLLDSIPLLRHLYPLAAAITDKVMLPMDAVGNALFNSAQRKRQEMYQQELRSTLKEVMDALQEASADDAAHHAMFVTATSIENALPMWEITVEVVFRVMVLALQQLLEESEKYVRPSITSSASLGGGNEREPRVEYEAVAAYMEDTQSASYFSSILLGLQNTVRVCCSFGNVLCTEQLLEYMFELTHLTSVVVVTAMPTPRVTVQSTLPLTRLQLLSTFLNLFVQCGSSFNSRGWQAAYKALSLVDALANGIEGIWGRQKRRLQVSTSLAKETGPVLAVGQGAPAKEASCPPSNGLNRTGASPTTGVPGLRQHADLWVGALNDVPPTIVDRASRDNRRAILSALRSVPESHVDLWLDRLFDATQYPAWVQLEMANGLVKVCETELQYTRTFSITILFDFVSICASFSSRLQWRELWANASEVFTLAGRSSHDGIALSSLEGLRLVALTYLMREELRNYSFQKEVLKPFESILMQNQKVTCRQKVMMILSELIDFRAAHLASGWCVVFSCLSHAAAIPDVAPAAWAINERVMTRHIENVKDCFSDLIFCLTTFACSGVEEDIPLRAVSYLVSCGHWLQYGLEAPPSEVRSAEAVLRWATRFKTVEQEVAASRTNGAHLARVTLAAEPLTQEALLHKPSTCAIKTRYHIWMSLFEGMVPIVVVHGSVRVRAHALSSIWALFTQYASLFDGEVQHSLFTGMVRPMLSTLLRHVPGDDEQMSPLMSDEMAFDRFDYRLLVYFALKGMVLACLGNAHLLELACTALLELVGTTKVTLRMLRNDYVDEVLRVCCDLAWAAPSSVTIAEFDRLRTEAVGSSDPVGSYTDMLYQWLPMEVRHTNPFAVGLVHEIQQIGLVDVVHFKRTASWTELHHSPAARNAPVKIPFSIHSATSVQQVRASQQRISATVYMCLTRGLYEQLQRLLRTTEADRDICLEVTEAIRHVMLGVGFYYLITRHDEAVTFLKSFLATAHQHSMPATHVEPVTEEAAALISSVSTTPPASAEVADSAVPELLLLIPYACVLIEFIASFDLGEVDIQVLQGDLSKYVRKFLDELHHSRQICVALQNVAQTRVRMELESEVAAMHGSTPEKGEASDQGQKEKEGDATASTRHNFKAYKGLQFSDIFRSARYPIAARSRYLTTQTEAAVSNRVFAEWCYLLHIYALKCVALLGTRSVFLQACSLRELAGLLNEMPSSLEEAAATAYFRSCWDAMNLHCNMPTDSCMELYTNCLIARL